MTNVNRKLNESEKTVIDELLENGYPKESIVLEGQLDSRRFVDFIVNDIETGLPMMMIEVKSCGERTSAQVRQLAYSSLKRIYEKCSSPIKAIAAILDRDKGRLEFIDFTEAIKENDFNCAVYDYNLPPYEVLTTGAQQKALNRQKESQKKKIVALKFLCWGVLLLFVLFLYYWMHSEYTDFLL